MTLECREAGLCPYLCGQVVGNGGACNLKLHPGCRKEEHLFQWRSIGLESLGGEAVADCIQLCGPREFIPRESRILVALTNSRSMVVEMRPMT